MASAAAATLAFMSAQGVPALFEQGAADPP
jgi:hypothetical protein